MVSWTRLNVTLHVHCLLLRYTYIASCYVTRTLPLVTLHVHCLLLRNAKTPAHIFSEAFHLRHDLWRRDVPLANDARLGLYLTWRHVVPVARTHTHTHTLVHSSTNRLAERFDVPIVLRRCSPEPDSRHECYVTGTPSRCNTFQFLTTTATTNSATEGNLAHGICHGVKTVLCFHLTFSLKAIGYLMNHRNRKQITETQFESNWFLLHLKYVIHKQERNIEACSRNHSSREKAISITYLCMCVCVCTGAGVCLRACSLTPPACNAPPYCHLRPLWLHHIFRHYLTNGTNFGEKKLLNINKFCITNTH
jgi:hypothetical protein